MTQPISEEIAAMTPMMRQYYELKSQSQDAILLFRMGDFYEIFGSDAELVAPKLELVLTSRERGDQKRIPFCGVPHHSARSYWLRLVKMGYKVAFADQVEDPKTAKGLVKRQITKIVTPGSIDELDGLDHETPNYLLALYQEPTKKTWAVALADTSSGEMRLGALADLSEVVATIRRFRPREILARRFFQGELATLLQSFLQEENCIIGTLPEAPLRDQSLQDGWLQKLFAKRPLTTMPCGTVVGGEAVIAGLCTYLSELLVSCGQFLTLRPLYDPEVMVLDETAIRDLEIFETARSRKADGSLFREVNRTLTPMGARLLKNWMLFPLLNGDKIQLRQVAVAQLLNGTDLLKIRLALKGAGDLQRLTSRISGKSATPLELALVRQTLAIVPELLQLLPTAADGELGPLRASLGYYREALAALAAALQDAPSGLGAGDRVFRSGFNKDLDRLTELSANGQQKVTDYEGELRKATGINSLKIKNHQTFGLLIEITKSNLSRVPSGFIRRQTMVNNERYVTTELVELDEALGSAKNLAIEKESSLYVELLHGLARHCDTLQSVAQALAAVDALQSLACKAKEADYARPTLARDGSVHLVGSRHPVVERFVGRHAFVGNDIRIEKSSRQVLITGPNMAGKSTIMRQVAISAILHQMGSYLPAQAASLPIFDRVFTRVGAADDLSRGHSTFLVEMSEAAQILRHATKNSLVILDEVGRGTSTQDGLAIASAILETLVAKVGCVCLFATHYHELVPFAESLEKVQIMQTQSVDKGGEIVFTRKLIPGASGSSFGIEVARIAGIPPAIIERAKAFLKSDGDKPSQTTVPAAGLDLSETPPQATQGFGNNRLHEVSERLLALRIHRTTPLQALNILQELKAMVESSAPSSLFDA